MKKVIDIKYMPFRSKQVKKLVEANIEGKANMFQTAGAQEGEVDGGTLKIAWAIKQTFDARARPAQEYVKFWIFYRKDGHKWEGECYCPMDVLNDPSYEEQEYIINCGLFRVE